MIELSVIVPSRNEMWLNRTIADVLEHSSDVTEVIAVLDGQWSLEPLAQHPRLQVVYLPESIGQRAATNYGAKLSTAKYICKLDAHCSMSPGFDRVLIDSAAELGDDVVQIPLQDNLHVFDWVCDGCQRRTYQGRTPVSCAACGGVPHHREVVWKRRGGVRTMAWRFDADLKFQYWNDYAKRPGVKQGDYSETMSCLGACWFINRERYWKLGGLDEFTGSWGQMGTEVGCKAWLSGGRMVTNYKAVFAHMFRTAGGDFGFPYPLRGSDVDKARKYSRDVWLGGTWPHQVRPLSWLIDHFAPVPGWENVPPAVRTTKTAGLVYYSDMRPEPWLLEACRAQILKAAPGMPLVSVTLNAPVIDFGRNIVLEGERGYLMMFQQILAGLEALDTDYAFLVEHDLLYSPSHFTFRPTDERTYYYNQHTWKVDAATGRALHYLCNQTSGLCASRELLVNHYRARVAKVRAEGFTRRMGFEPGTHTRPERIDDYGHATWMSAQPNIDIRHTHTLTPSRWSRDKFRNQKYCQGWTEAEAVPGWGQTAGRFREFLDEHVLVAV